MRVSSTQMIGRYQKQLNDSYEQQAKQMERSDGSRLHRPSDDSVSYSKYLRYQNTQTENEQYQSNVQNGISWMKTADAALSNMKDLLTTIHEKTIQAATDTNGETDIKAIGKEVKAKVQEIVSLLNSQQGDRYLFSGQDDIVSPFTISVEEKDRGAASTLDDHQSQFFHADADGSGNATQMIELKDSNGNKYYLSTISGAVYSESFMTDGYKDVVANGRTEADTTIKYDDINDRYYTEIGKDASGVIDGWSNSDVHVSDYFESTGLIRERKDKDGNDISREAGSMEITDESGATSKVKMEFVALKQFVVNYQGDSKQISMVKRNGLTDPTADTVNVVGQALSGSDIFDSKNSGNQVNGASSGSASINDLFMVAAKMEAGDVKWLASEGITITDKAHAQVVEAQTSIAARQNVYESVSTMLDKQSATITEDISNASDADVAKLAIDLMTMQTIYNMSLSVGSRILPQSLADYL